MIIYASRALTINDSLYKAKAKKIFIVKYDSKTPNFIMPSSLTCFVHKYGTSYNTQKKYADEVCQYINYIITKIAKHDNPLFECLAHEGLRGLNYYHLANYINYLSTDISMFRSSKIVTPVYRITQLSLRLVFSHYYSDGVFRDCILHKQNS